MKTIEERIAEIKEEFGEELFNTSYGEAQFEVISNGQKHFLLDDSRYNGFCYNALEAEFCDSYFAKADAKRTEICDIVLETEEDCFEHIGYTFGDRTITYTMDGKYDY